MRAKKAKIRQIKPDLKYHSELVAKLISYVMKDGKKSVAQKQVYSALEALSSKLNQKPVEILESALQTITPQMEVRSRRVGGAAYQVPMPVKPRRGLSLALRWLIGEAKKRSNRDYHTFGEKLVAEISDALNSVGGAIQKRDAAHKMAEANKAFSHFRW